MDILRQLPAVLTVEQVRHFLALILAPFDPAWMWELGWQDVRWGKRSLYHKRCPNNRDYLQGWGYGVEQTCPDQMRERILAGNPAPKGRPVTWLYSVTG